MCSTFYRLGIHLENEMKTCTKCKIEKSFDEFGVNRAKSDGKRTVQAIKLSEGKRLLYKQSVTV